MVLGTWKFESGVCDLPPEGSPEKSYVKILSFRCSSIFDRRVPEPVPFGLGYFEFGYPNPFGFGFTRTAAPRWQLGFYRCGSLLPL